MALWEILKILASGYGTTEFSSEAGKQIELFIAMITLMASIFSSLKSFIKHLRFHKDGVLFFLISMPAIFLFIIAAFWGLICSLTVFHSPNIGTELIGIAVERYGVELYYEMLKLVAISLFIMVSFSIVSRYHIRNNIDSENVVVRLLSHNILEYGIALILVVISVMRLTEMPLPVFSENTWLSFYIYECFALAVKSTLNLFILIWTAAFGMHGQSNMKAPMHLYGKEWLYGWIRRRYLARSFYMLLNVVLALFILYVNIEDIKVYDMLVPLNNEEARTQQREYNNKFVRIENSCVVYVSRQFFGTGNADLWVVRIGDQYCMFAQASGDLTSDYLKNNHQIISGKFQRYSDEQFDWIKNTLLSMEPPPEIPLPVSRYYIDQTEQVSYSKYWPLNLAAGIPALVLLNYIFTVLFPQKSLCIRRLRKKTPYYESELDRLKFELETEQILYDGISINPCLTITPSYLIDESLHIQIIPIKDIESVSMSDMQARIYLNNGTSIELTLHGQGSAVLRRLIYVKK